MCQESCCRSGNKIKERLEWSDLKLLRAVIVFLDTRSWFRVSKRRCTSLEEADSDDDTFDDEKAEIKEAAEYNHFCFPSPSGG